MSLIDFHPWRELRGRPHIDVSWRHLGVGVDGRTDGLSRIELSRRLGQRGRRCTVTHEMVHIEWGHRCGQDEAVERKVRVETARRLIPLTLLGNALAFEVHDLEAVAFDIWVTRSVLEDRLAALTTTEYQYLLTRTATHREAF